MTPERWQLVKAQFDHALELPPSARPAFLADADPAVAGLLAHHEQSTANHWLDFHLHSPPQQIGPYRILKPLGQGGMGAVFLAQRDDGAFRQLVAIKLIRPSAIPDSALRFRQERQILADLQHPHIARLLDGGETASGAPYLVMEYIDGRPLLSFSGPLRSKLHLFLQLCQALQYAHSNLIVHRDLKPANILVTPANEIKLLDFGIAKILGPLDVNSTSGLLTPAYASPEQFLGDSITTASDVYSLAAVLHEFLTARPALRTEGLSVRQIVDAVQNTQPAPAGINPDLDAILARALRKEPRHRYPSVEQFAADLQRHLDGFPVHARANTLSYRAGRWIRRNRFPLAAAAAFLFTVAAGLTATIAERNRAEHRFAQVRKLAHAVLFDYQDAIAPLAGSVQVRSRMLTDSLEYIESLSAEAAGDASLLEELAQAYQQIGMVQGNANFSNLGDSRSALQSYQHALALLRQRNRLRPASLEVHRQLAILLGDLGDMESDAGRPQSAYTYYHEGFEIIRAAAAKDASLPFRRQLARKHLELGVILGHPAFANLGRTAEAVEHLAQGVSIAEGLLAEDPADTHRQFILIPQLRFHGDLLRSAGRSGQARHAYLRAKALLAAWLAKEPTNADARDTLFTINGKLAELASDLGDHAAALPLIESVWQDSRRLAGSAPSDAHRQRNYVVTIGRYAELLANARQPARALPLSRQYLNLSEAAAASNRDSRMLHDVIDARILLARILRESGHPAEASAQLATAASNIASLRRTMPDSFYLDTQQARLSLLQPRTAQALDRIESLIRRDPARADFQLWRKQLRLPPKSHLRSEL
jgi:tetratricopeptide (TPR) repeat protein